MAILAVITHQIVEWNYLNPDGLSYLEMGAHTLESGPARLLSLHWSPLYPAPNTRSPSSTCSMA